MARKKNKSGSSLLHLSPGLLPSKREKRIQLIVDAVITCIYTLGIEQTNYGSVGKQAKMLRAHVAYYFPDWEQLVALAIKSVYGELQKRVVATLMKARSPKDRLEDYFTMYFDWLTELPAHSQTILLLYTYAGTRKEYRQLHTQVREVGLNRIQELVEQYWGSTKGLSKADLHELALNIQCLLTGNLLQRYTTADKTPLAQLKEQTLRGVHALMESYAKRD